MAGEDENHDENANIPPPGLSYIGTVKKTGNGPVQVSTVTNRQISVLPPKTAEEILARERERKARTTLLMSIPEDHLTKFHIKMMMLKRCGESYKSRFGGNGINLRRSIKIHLKQKFESFFVSQIRGLAQGYDRFLESSKSTGDSMVQAYPLEVQSEDSLMVFTCFLSKYPDMRTKPGWTVLVVMISTNNLVSLILMLKDLLDSLLVVYNWIMRILNREKKLAVDAKVPVRFDKDQVSSSIAQTQDKQENFALMAYNNLGSDTEVTSCSKECDESYAKLKKLYDEQREQLEAVKEKEELKTKLENFQSSSKGLSKLLNIQMSAKDKSGLGSSSNDRIYMPPKSDFGIDKSKFTYSPKQSKISKSDAKTSDFASCESNSSVETLEFVSKPAVNEPKAISKPKVWSDDPIIKKYESDSDDEYVIKPSKEQEKPSFAFVNTVKHAKTPREIVKEQNTCSLNPKAEKRD
ncbi:hypothetical protein Tco_0143468 [Tanacetum coccineum]